MTALYDLIQTSFDQEELERFCRQKLRLDYENLRGRSKSAKAFDLQGTMQRNGRLNELLVALKDEKPHLDLRPYLYHVIAERFNSEAAISGLLGRFGLPVRDFPEPEKFPWGSEPWREQKAEGLQAHMARNGRLPELQEALTQHGADLSFLREAVAEKPDSVTSLQPPTTAEYANFDIQFRDVGNGRVLVEVTDSPRGQEETDYQMNRHDPDFADVQAYLRDLIGRAEDGEKFGAMLLPQPILQHLSHSVTEAKLDKKQGVRVRLRFDLEEPGQIELSQLPWEYGRNRTGYLALDLETPVIRYVKRNLPDYRPIAVPRPVKILVALAAPTDQPDLEIEQEVQNIKDALQPLQDGGQIQVKIISHTTRHTLFDAIHLEFAPHILHFIGHGDLRGGVGGLLLEKEDGTSDFYDATDIENLLDDSGVKVVVLNACRTAEHTARAIMAVAPRLVWSGVPAVVAMQFKVPDTTAVAFTRYFYRFLAQSDPLDVAMTKTRKALRNRDKLFWAIPVLYLRAKDGVIWR